MKNVFKGLLLVFMFSVFFTSCSINDELPIEENTEITKSDPPNEDDDPETEETGG